MNGSTSPARLSGTGEELFHEHRKLLFSVAYRLLGSAADAEDAVQDAWIKWSSADRSQVADPKAYLARIVSNVALERLRSARHKRETYVGPWLPEPILTGGDASDAAVGAESVSMAMLVVLETLSPLERAVFVLREVFGFGHAEIAAATGGDINALMELLSPDVTLWTDGGGKVRQALRPVVGAPTVARWFAALGTVACQGVEPSDMNAELVEINGGPGMVFSGGGRVVATVTLDFDVEGRIMAIHNVANPDKLGAIAGGTRYDVGTT